ncbi:hypothetical protein K503DRAFT_848502 [Rhizopogon vinicolor AM-OR11-026]|uniref:Protein kinase domain-containing protein n=1 Tax=Rhizopogon vinicolor AM-OR11-026 TaxID=1314800 RepID=A0A1B7N8R0_9AGAM|nr:hypothetical protein K503DRAFT_848502 [Rhizopogon vinicolor AM-OR11-026]
MQDGARIEIGRYFCGLPLNQDPSNHCVPIYDVLQVPTDGNLAIRVMPLLIHVTDPYFDTVGEVVDRIHQLFELNILMDGSIMSHDFKRPARHHTRTQSPSRYSYIDFDISRKYEAEDYSKPWNPFPPDVWYLGHTTRETSIEAVEQYNITFHALILTKQRYSNMMHTDPAQRPNMDDVFSRFRILRQGLGNSDLRSRVAHLSGASLFDFIAHWARLLEYIVRRIPSTHTPSIITMHWFPED